MRVKTFLIISAFAFLAACDRSNASLSNIQHESANTGDPAERVIIDKRGNEGFGHQQDRGVQEGQAGEVACFDVWRELYDTRSVLEAEHRKMERREELRRIRRRENRRG